MTHMRRVFSVALLFCACTQRSHSERAAATVALSASQPRAPSNERSPQRALEAMDTRRAVPLLPAMALHQKTNMRDHLVAVQQIAANLATGDFDAIAAAGKRLGSSESMGQTCTHMGMGAPGFAEQALAFHRTADRIVEAAGTRSSTAVLAELDATLRACTSCHETWKQQLVDDATWQGFASSRTH